MMTTSAEVMFNPTWMRETGESNVRRGEEEESVHLQRESRGGTRRTRIQER